MKDKSYIIIAILIWVFVICVVYLNNKFVYEKLKPYYPSITRWEVLIYGNHYFVPQEKNE